MHESFPSNAQPSLSDVLNRLTAIEQNPTIEPSKIERVRTRLNEGLITPQEALSEAEMLEEGF